MLARVDQIVETAPASVAVRDGDGVLTYGELSLRADRLAHRLREMGVGRGDLVGQCLERSAGLVVASLAILRSGAAFVAIDPAYPDARITWMLEDSGAAVVVTDEAAARGLKGRTARPLIALTSAGELQRRPGDGAGDSVAAPGATDPAYVVYTSGSTGRPKGAVVEHRALANLVDWHCATFGLSAADRCTQISSPGFDATVCEIWPALACGAAIVVVPESLRTDPGALRDWLTAEAVTVTFLPTALADGIIGLEWPDDAGLRYLLAGGDALTRRPRAGLPFAVVNNYGLSETAVVATSGTVSVDGDGAPSIGRPITGVVVEVVDEQLRAVAPGVEGELLVGGVAVARGYLDRPDLTAERFLDTERGRYFRTGDRVRQRSDGEIEFLGRLDDQLSIRGFRVEPGEIAAALNVHPAVGASVVVAVGTERQLIAYAVPTADERPEPAELTEYLSGVLPAYMVPARYVWLDALPVTPHGKIDRSALPDPADLPADQASDATAIEAEVAVIVAGLLELDEIAGHENVFLLGGHSLFGAQLIVRLADRFDVELSLRFLFDHPTPAAIAAEVERQLAEDADLVPR